MSVPDYIEEAMDEIDAAIFSGDTFTSGAARNRLREMMARWERGLVEFDTPRRKIVMWHGYNITLFDDLIKVVGCDTDPDEEDNRVLYFEGSLDEFSERWNRPMQVHADGTIFVTQHSNFGQR